MTWVLLAAGTRGDVQPYAALAARWQTAGRRVLVAAPRAFAALVQAHGVPWADLPPGPNALLAQPQFKQALSMRPNVRQTWRFWRQAEPLYAAQLQAGWELARTHHAERVVFGLATLWGRQVAQALSVEPLVAALQPLTRTRQHPSALWGDGRVHTWPQPAWFNLFTHCFIENTLTLAWRGVTQRWRAQHGLPAEARRGLGWPEIPHQYGYSPALAPRPSDWPATHQVTGYWFSPAQAEPAPTLPILTRWLADHHPVLYLSVFTPGWQARPAVVHALLAALEQVNAWAVMPADQLTAPHPRVLAVPPVPHSWLFPQVAAVVHHGGCGTTHASLRARRPMLLLPQGADQFFWAGRVQALRLGPPPLPPADITPARLAASLHALIHDRYPAGDSPAA